MPRISVITASWNQGQFIEQALQSVRDQTPAAVEHLVVDSGSRDETDGVLARYEGQVRRLDKSCRTMAEAFNWGLQHAQGEVIGWLNADDLYFPGALSRVLAAFDRHPDVQVFIGGYRLLDERGLVVRRRIPKRWSPMRLDRNSDLMSPAIFLRREVLEQLGGLDAQLEYCEEHDLGLRLGTGGAVVRRLRRVLAGRRLQADGRRHGNPSPERRLAVSLERNQVALRLLDEVPLRAVLEEAQARVECDGLNRWDSCAWDRGVLQEAMATQRRYHGESAADSRFLLRLGTRHVCKECEQLLKRPRYAVRFLPVAGREFVRRYLSRKIFTTRYLSPCPLRLPARYHRHVAGDDAPLISVVTPNLNQGQYLEATIRSVLDQGYPNLEYVVQDAGSTDSSLEIIRRYGERLTHWESVRDRGQADGINRGMQHTTGEIMAWLNSDDLLLPGSLAYVAEYFQQHPDVDVVYGHRVLINEQGEQIGRWVLPPHDDKAIAWADYIPQETMFWRRRAWERTGGRIDDSFSFAMDWDLILRFREAGLRFARLPRFLGAFRITEEQKTTQLIATVGAREMARLRYRVHGCHASNRRIRRAVRPYVWRHWVYDTLYTSGLARY